ADLSQPIQCAHLLLQYVRFSPKNAIGLRIKAVELEIDGWPDFVELFEKSVVTSNALPVGVNHHEGNGALLGCPDEFDDLRMNRRLSARELDDFGFPLGSHEV